MESMSTDAYDVDLDDEILDESIEEDAVALQEKMNTENGEDKPANPTSDLPVSF